VVVGAIYGAQAPGDIVGWDQAALSVERLPGSVRLSDLDLSENEVQIGANIGNHDKTLTLVFFRRTPSSWAGKQAHYYLS
jgi:hypothetical protein